MRAISAIALLVSVPSFCLAATPVATVELSNFKFAPANVQLPAGVPVVLHLNNVAGGGHNFSAPEFFAAASAWASWPSRPVNAACAEATTLVSWETSLAIVPDAADLGDAVAAAGARGCHRRHHRDLLRAKGTGRSMRERSSSTSMLSSPIRCMAVASSPVAASVSRSFNAPSSAASAFCRQRSSL